MRRIMILILLLLVLTMPAVAQNVTRIRKFTTAIPDDGVVTTRLTGIYNHRLTWTGAGTRTSCTIKLEQSVDGVSFTDLISAQSCTTDSAATATGYANFVRINVTVLTGSGNTVFAAYAGTTVAPSVGTVTVDNAAVETGGNLASVKTDVDKIPSQGPALPSASTPVVTSPNPLVNGCSGGSGCVTAMTGTTSTVVIAAVTSSYLYITHCSLSVDSATVATLMVLQDGDGGTAIWSGYVPVTLGREVGWPKDSPLKIPTISHGLYIKNATTGSSSYASCSGFSSTVSY